MATSSHCALCFETLAADLENRLPLRWEQVQDLWARYESLQKSGEVDREQTPYLQDEELDGGEGLDDETGEDESANGEHECEEEDRRVTRSTLQVPSISRLQASSPGSTSSISSTPSSLSTTSSSVALGGNSKSSSN